MAGDVAGDGVVHADVDALHGVPIPADFVVVVVSRVAHNCTEYRVPICAAGTVGVTRFGDCLQTPILWSTMLIGYVRGVVSWFSFCILSSFVRILRFA